jgi:hypothetical protein
VQCAMPMPSKKAGGYRLLLSHFFVFPYLIRDRRISLSTGASEPAKFVNEVHSIDDVPYPNKIQTLLDELRERPRSSTVCRHGRRIAGRAQPCCR